MGVVNCSTHPNNFSTGICARCKQHVCDVCKVDVGGARYCSIMCFTEQKLEDKGKLDALKQNDPLAGVRLKDDSSVVLPAQTGRSDDSSVAVSKVGGEQDATSILDMEAIKSAKKKMEDVTSELMETAEEIVVPAEGRTKEPTS